MADVTAAGLSLIGGSNALKREIVAGGIDVSLSPLRGGLSGRSLEPTRAANAVEPGRIDVLVPEVARVTRVPTCGSRPATDKP